jgi:hypothetical protein
VATASVRLGPFVQSQAVIARDPAESNAVVGEVVVGK